MKAVVEGTLDFAGLEKVVQFTIDRRDLNGFEADNIEDQIYTGKEIVPTTIVREKQLVRIKGDNREYVFDRNEIKSLQCIEYVSGINDIIIDDVEKLRYENDKFKFHSSLEGEYLVVYDMMGRMVLYTKITDKSSITLKHLPAGVYVAKVKNESIKVAVI